MKSRYSFIFLVALSMVFSFVAVMVSLQAVNNNNHKWCQIVDTITAIPVPKPTNPKVDPSRERAFEFYEEFVNLQRSLGC